MTSGSGEKQETVEENQKELRKINKGDLAAVKHALDEILVDVVTDADYPEDFTASNVRILLSLVVCLMAPASHFLPAYVEEHTSFDLSKKAIILLCLAVYAVGSIILTAFAYMYEKDAILFTKQKKGTFSSSGLRVSTNMERYDDTYQITIAPLTKSGKNKEQQFERAPMEFGKSVTKWIDVNGVIAEDIVKKDMNKFLKSFEKSAYKKKS